MGSGHITFVKIWTKSGSREIYLTFVGMVIFILPSSCLFSPKCGYMKLLFNSIFYFSINSLKKIDGDPSIFMNQLPRIYKRTAYHKHKNETESMPLVMNILKNCKRGEMKRIAAQTGINYNTLKDFHRKLKDNPDFTPYNKQIRPNKRIFTIEEENNVAEFI